MQASGETLRDTLTRSSAIGCALPVSEMPKLGATHTSRLRKLWSLGRPAHLMELTGIELDLLVHGLIEVLSTSTHSSGPQVKVTQQGIIHLSKKRQATIKTQAGHHHLGERLAAHLQAKGLWTWENVEFQNPCSDHSSRSWGVVRPDVFACKPALKAQKAEPAIYEVKVSRADFLADIAKPEKRLAYTELAQAVYYCCPDGMLSPTEIPEGFGLIFEDKGGNFVIAKKAKRNKTFSLSADTVMTLMVKRQMPLGDSFSE